MVGSQATISSQKIFYWDLAKNNPSNSNVILAEMSPLALDICPKGENVLAASRDQKIYRWDITSIGAPPKAWQIDREDTVDSLLASPDCRWLLLQYSQGGIELWDIHKQPREVIQLDSNATTTSQKKFSPDSQFLILEADQKPAKLWDLRQKREIQPFDLDQPSNEIRSLQISPNCNWLAAGYSNGDIQLWNNDDLNSPILRVANQSQPVQNLIISQDCRWLVANIGGMHFAWDMDLDDPASKRLIIPGMSPVYLSPDNRWLVNTPEPAASDRYPIIFNIWDLARIHEIMLLGDQYLGDVDLTEFTDDQLYNRLMAGHEGHPEPAGFSPDGRWLVTYSDWPDGTVRIWDMARESYTPSNNRFWTDGISYRIGPDYTWGFPGAHSQDGRWIAGVDKNNVYLWDLSKSSPDSLPESLPEFDADVSHLFFSEDGKRLVIGAQDGAITIWDLENRIDQPSLVLKDCKNPIEKLILSPNRQIMVAFDKKNILYYWDFTREAPFVVAYETNFDPTRMLMQFSPDSNWLYLGGDDQQLIIDDFRDLDDWRQKVITGIPNVTRVIYSLDSRILALMSGMAFENPDIYLSVPEDDYLTQITAPDVTDMVFMPDSKGLIAGVGSKEFYAVDALLWDLNRFPDVSGSNYIGYPSKLTNANLALQYTKQIAVSPDGRWIATMQENTVHIWDRNDLQSNPKVLVHGQARGLNSIAFSPDSRWLATASNERAGNTVILWDVQKESNVAIPLIANRQVFSISFSTIGEYLIADNRIIYLDLNRYIEIACAVAGRNFSQLEWQNYFRGETYRTTCKNLAVYPSE